MEKLIIIYSADIAEQFDGLKEGENLISARALFSKLKVKEFYSTWMNSNLKGFKEKKDYIIIPHETKGMDGRVLRCKNHLITVPMAKNIIEKNEKFKKLPASEKERILIALDNVNPKSIIKIPTNTNYDKVYLNDLNKEFLNINFDETTGEALVSGRELHERLEINTPYRKWFDRMCEYGFVENVDFCVMDKNVQDDTAFGGLRKVTDHILKLDMAKEIAMIQRNEAGKKIRRYLIEVEKAWNSPEKVMARALLMANEKLKLTTKELEEKTKFINQISASKNSIDMNTFAKTISNYFGFIIGRNKLYEILREWKLILKNSTIPSQIAINQGILEVSEYIDKDNYGNIITRQKTMVTGQGQSYILKKLLKENNLL